MAYSVFKDRIICAVDRSNPERPVYVTARTDGGTVTFDSLSTMPKLADASCALSPRNSLIRRINSPFSSLSKTRRVLPSLLDVQMPFSLEECSVAFSHMEPGEDGRISALASAARLEDVNRLIADLKVMDIDPMHIDVEGIALWEESMIADGEPGRGVKSAVLKAERSASTVVFGIGSRILSAHALSSFDAGHLKRLLVSAYGSASAIEWRLCGSQGGSKECLEFFDGLGPDLAGRIVKSAEPAQFLARAIARRALLGGSNAVNLRKGDLKHAGLVELETSRLRAVATVLVLCGFLLGASSICANLILDAKVSSLEGAFLAKAEELAGGNLGGAMGMIALSRAEKAVAKDVRAARPILAPFEPSPQLLLREIAVHAVGSGLLIEMMAISQDEISVTGTASSWKAPESLEKLLKGKGFAVSLVREESLADESVRFTVATAGGVK